MELLFWQAIAGLGTITALLAVSLLGVLMFVDRRTARRWF